ncbi:MAG TPA: glycosyl transferase family 1 [Peptococcaceae bacterium]|nr:glycosyl transferase family 1 [Peptococcaceae bacterium]
MERPVQITDYYPFIDAEVKAGLEEYRRLLAGVSVQHINSMAFGGGVAELLRSLVPAMRSLGLHSKWSVLQADEKFFRVTKDFHNAVHGQSVELTSSHVSTYQEGNARNLEIVDENADFVVIHDLQPLALVAGKERTRGLWIWYCHVDVSSADPRVWGFLRQYIQKFDLVIFHLKDYFRSDLHVPQHAMPPGIDPLSEKNRELSQQERQKVIGSLGIDLDRPMVLQVSRFDRLKDPLGVIEAFRIARDGLDVQLVLAGGGAADDPEGNQVLAEVQAVAAGDADVRVIALDHSNGALEINALQRSAAVVVQKSLREGFGLTVTEALWKSRPVVGSAVGGIRYQIIHGQTGLLVHSVAEAAVAIRQLLKEPEFARKLGAAGKEHVRKNFILPVYLLNWMKLLWFLKTRKREGC